MSPARQQLSLVVLRDIAHLMEHLPAWENLCTSALEPNVFYEPWILLPAIEAFGAGVEFLFVLIYATAAGCDGKTQRLFGFFPLHREQKFRGLPMCHLKLWNHVYGCLCTPLVRAERAGETATAFLNWLVTAAPAIGFMKFKLIPGEGPFQELLKDRLAEHNLRTYTIDTYSRPAFRPAVDAETYLKQTLSGNYRKQMKRKENRLAECGRMEYATLMPDGDLETWLTTFLRLECSGWKGREGSALASKPADRDFFLQIAREAFQRRRLIMQSLVLNGQPIAIYSAFTAGNGSFDFKPAYNEDFSRYSPGILLELERFRYLHTRPDLAWMDSCSDPDSFRNAIWGEKRKIKTVLVSTGSWKGDLFLAVIALRKWLRDKIKKITSHTAQTRKVLFGLR